MLEWVMSLAIEITWCHLMLTASSASISFWMKTSPSNALHAPRIWVLLLDTSVWDSHPLSAAVASWFQAYMLFLHKLMLGLLHVPQVIFSGRLPALHWILPCPLPLHALSPQFCLLSAPTPHCWDDGSFLESTHWLPGCSCGMAHPLCGSLR